MQNYSAEYILSAADELNSRPPKKLRYATPEELFDSFLDRLYSFGSKPACPVKDRLLCHSYGILDCASRVCCMVIKSGFRRTLFIHAGVQLALAICVYAIYNQSHNKGVIL